MNKWFELLLGLILVIVPILVAWYSQMWGAWNFWSAAGTFFKGGLFWFVLMIGVLFLLLGISDLKESGRAQPRPMHPRPQQPIAMPVVDMTTQSSQTPAQKRSRKK
jgi:hypothetical protein